MEAILLLITFLILLALGVPIAYSLGLSAMVTLMLSLDTGITLITIGQRLTTGLDSFTLLAIPFFILAGQVMNRGGIAERLVRFAKDLMGHLPGGLSYVNVVACMLFGAISGSAVAALSAIGGIMINRMEKEGYPRGFSAAVNTTASTTGLIIPPSNVLIVYSLASGGASVAALFVAGYLPGLLIGAGLMFVCFSFAVRKKMPVLDRVSFKTMLLSFGSALPSLMLLVIVMGGILAGIFTATEASAVAVVYTLILSMGVYQELSWKQLPEVLLETVKTTAVVLFLVGTSIALSWVLSYENIPQDMSVFMLSLSDNKFVILLIINITLLAVGVFMDITPAVLIFTPIFLPVVEKIGVDPVHFGIIMVTNLCIGLCTPPVGSVLFVGVSVAQIKISQILRPLLPMFVAMLLALMAITLIPGLSLWLPEIFGL